MGSKLEEFLELDALARETPVEKWGMINVVLTCSCRLRSDVWKTISSY